MEFIAGKKVKVSFNAVIQLVEDEGPMIRVEKEDGDRVWVYDIECQEIETYISDEEE